MPMIGASESELERDRKKLRNFTKNNPYPSYKEVMTLIVNESKRDSAFDKNEIMMMLSEYGEDNHDWMKEIYENVLEKKIVKANGERINNKGGKVAMVWNYYTLLIVLIHFLKQNKLKEDDEILIHYNYKDCISSYWNGIGDWRH